MTNDEINRKVAALRGRTIIETQEECSAFTPGATWVSGGDYYEHTQVWAIPSQWVDLFHNDPASMDWYQYNGVPNYCDDPAAWGALLIELAKEGYGCGVQTSLVGTDGNDLFTAGVWGNRRSERVTDVSPGRALCLAYLSASGVEL